MSIKKFHDCVTKEFAKVLSNLELSGKTLALLDGSNESVSRVSRNIARFELMRAQDANAYDIVRNKNIVVSKTAVEKLIERVTK